MIGSINSFSPSQYRNKMFEFEVYLLLLKVATSSGLKEVFCPTLLEILVLRDHQAEILNYREILHPSLSFSLFKFRKSIAFICQGQYLKWFWPVYQFSKLWGLIERGDCNAPAASNFRNFSLHKIPIDYFRMQNILIKLSIKYRKKRDWNAYISRVTYKPALYKPHLLILL